MIIGVGTDIAKVSRINMSESIFTKYLSDEEIEICKDFNEQRKQEFVAGRWAAKEAIFKALKDKEFNYKKLSVLKAEDGSPICNYKDYKIHISISHEKDGYAIAFAIVEK